MDTCAFDKLFFMNVPHILERIFFSLDYESYKTCMHVNTKWSKLLKSDAYQKKAKSVFQNEILEDHQRLWTAARSGNYSCARQLLSYEMLDINYIYTVYHRFGGRRFVCFGFDPASAMVQKLNTRNVYLRTDDKRCSGLIYSKGLQNDRPK